MLRIITKNRSLLFVILPNQKLVLFFLIQFLAKPCQADADDNVGPLNSDVVSPLKGDGASTSEDVFTLGGEVGRLSSVRLFLRKSPALQFQNHKS